MDYYEDDDDDDEDDDYMPDPETGQLLFLVYFHLLNCNNSVRTRTPLFD